MKKENRLIFASTVGVIAVLGFFAFRKWLKNRREEHDNHYHGYLFSSEDEDDHHGVEYFSMR